VVINVGGISLDARVAPREIARAISARAIVRRRRRCHIRLVDTNPMDIAFLAASLPAATRAAGEVSPLFSFESAIALFTLTALEIVLGIDNVVFIAILANKLPENQRKKARQVGLFLAMFIRILLLLAIGYVVHNLTRALFEIPKFWTTAAGDVHGVSGRDLIILIGGLFLIGKATFEIHDKLEGDEHHGGKLPSAASFGAIIVQILLLDIVFSLDSVITAVGMADHVPIMIAAVVIAVVVMLVFAGAIGAFVERHPTMKMLALSFLLLIGVMLVVEGMQGHIPKGYIYFAMAFSLIVELLNMKIRKKKDPVHLHQTYVKTEAAGQG
jgi:predicted tellurium resistance membrane protein TerC